ncbi:MAG TPA: prepilin-type N-terminal cleavage/methylation domain-containing protein, partial [Candidatus Binatia bacterium]|nr:prepilin-type N-terminal cleavage/methylation domain-containing protein [Candidatus Binatia bacterium]
MAQPLLKGTLRLVIGNTVNDAEAVNPPFTFVHTVVRGKGNNMKINSPRKAGFTLVEIMIVVAIIG